MVVSSALGGNPTEIKCLPKVIVDPWWAVIFWSPQRFREGRGIEGSFKVETALGARGPWFAPGGGGNLEWSEHKGRSQPREFQRHRAWKGKSEDRSAEGANPGLRGLR